MSDRPTPAAKQGRDHKSYNLIEKNKDGRWITSAEMQEMEFLLLKVCLKLIEDECGYETPFEKFFSSLITYRLHDKTPSPEDIEDALEEYRRDIKDLEKLAARFAKEYAPSAAEDQAEAA